MSTALPVSSMTGYGEASAESARHRISVRARSVNHRNLDVSIRMPESYRQFEGIVRGVVKERLQRGRIDLTIDIECLEEPAPQVEVDTAVVQQLRELVDGLSQQGPELRPLSAGDLLRLPGVLSLKRETESWNEAESGFLQRVVSESVAQLVATRQSEGAALAADLARGLDELQQRVVEIEAGREETVVSMRERLETRLRRAVENAGLDDSRLLQEVAVLVEKSDIGEEVQRLFAHLRHGLEILDSTRPLGKRFDFLLQELQREISTIGAKCRDLALSKIVLDARALCEQLREQVQNVE